METGAGEKMRNLFLSVGLLLLLSFFVGGCIHKQAQNNTIQTPPQTQPISPIQTPNLTISNTTSQPTQPMNQTTTPPIANITGNASSWSIIKTIPIGSAPLSNAAIAITPDSQNVYVSSPFDSAVFVIATSNNSVIGKINTNSIFDDPVALATSPDGKYVYGAGDDNVSVISTSNNSFVDTIHTGSPSVALVVSPDSHYVYVVNSGPVDSIFCTPEMMSDNSCYEGTISVISTSNNTVTDTINLGPVGAGFESHGITITPNGQYVYVAGAMDGGNVGDGLVVVISTSNNTIVHTIPVGSDPYNIAISPDGHYLYIPDIIDSSVWVISTSNDSIVDKINIKNAISLAPGYDGLYLYVVSPALNQDSVSVISTSNYTILDSIRVGNSPKAIAVTPNDQYIYIANYADNLVSVISRTS